MGWQSVWYIFQGVSLSLQYTLVALLIGMSGGMLLALAQLNQKKVVRVFAKSYISIFRGTPLLVQLSLIYFALPAVLHISISGWTAGVIAFSLNSSAYLSEVFRSGFQSIDKGQYEACQMLHIPKWAMYKDIILPQVLRIIWPSLMNETISLLKETALISVIGEADIMRRAILVASEHYQYLLPLCVAAGCYYVLVLGIQYLSKQVEKRLVYA